MQIVIEIPEEEFEFLKNAYHSEDCVEREYAELRLSSFFIEDGKPLPKAHGRLIDADKMTSELLTIDSNYAYMADWCLQVIDAQPTIIEADEEETT